jgi:hypothetical protein
MAHGNSLGEAIGLVFAIVAAVIGVPMALVGITVSIMVIVDDRKKKQQMIRDHELADRGCCLFCGHLKDHSQCARIHDNVTKFTATGRCTFCGQKMTHGMCAMIAEGYDSEEGTGRAQGRVVAPPPVVLRV